VCDIQLLSAKWQIAGQQYKTLKQQHQLKVDSKEASVIVVVVVAVAAEVVEEEEVVVDAVTVVIRNGFQSPNWVV
jgi:hypothetical protein